MYEHILVPTDGSDVAEAAVDHALDLAEKYDAEVHALYVVDIDSVNFSLGTEQVDRLKQGRFDEMGELKERADEATGVVAERGVERDGLRSGVDAVARSLLRRGVQWRELGGLARALRPTRGRRRQSRRAPPHRQSDDWRSQCVASRHQRAGVRRALLGSVTERTLRSTHVPVLVVDYLDEE